MQNLGATEQTCYLRQGEDCDIYESCSYTRMAGCFSPESLITMADGSTKRADRIQEDDVIWKPVLRRGFRVALPTAGPETVPMLELSVGNATLRVTTGHPMMVVEEGRSSAFKPVSLDSRATSGIGNGVTVKRADELRVGDRLPLSDGTVAAISSIRSFNLDSKLWVYNFRVKSDSADPREHLIVANGVITVDLTLQEKIEKK